jgi:predicted RNase H-like HicB family nuclease
MSCAARGGCNVNRSLCNNSRMKRPFAATVWKEGDWFVSQCLELDVASQGETEEEALANLREALELYFEAPQATRPPMLRTIVVEVGAA